MKIVCFNEAVSFISIFLFSIALLSAEVQSPLLLRSKFLFFVYMEEYLSQILGVSRDQIFILSPGDYSDIFGDPLAWLSSYQVAFLKLVSPKGFLLFFHVNGPIL